MATDKPSGNNTLPEFSLIDRWFRRRHTRDDVILGIGDDAALTRVPAGDALVTATDMLVEGTHFLADAGARSLGHRALAVNLSDLAAMGAEPRWATLALSLPATDDAWLEEFAAGFFALADRSGTELIGGDTVRGPRTITVTVQGVVREGAYCSRAGARPGDLLFVTGAPGAAAAGRTVASRDGASPLLTCFEFPEPRLAAGADLAELATAVIDISDGLQPDLGHLLRASGVAARVELERLPLALLLENGVDAEAAVEFALLGGEDYELLFTVPPERESRLQKCAEAWGCALTRLGEITAGEGAHWLFDGAPFTITASGFRHF